MRNKQEEYIKAKGNKCPACGSGSIDGWGHPDYDGDSMTQDVACNTCGATWKDNYRLVGFSDLEIPA